MVSALLVAVWTTLLGPVVGTLTTTEICTKAWGKDHRHVTVAMKRQVLAAAGIPWTARGGYEIDHIVPRELGGLDQVENLQAQCCIVAHRIVGPAHQKDVLENRLHRLVCAGTVDLAEAQQALHDDWQAAALRWPKQP